MKKKAALAVIAAGMLWGIISLFVRGLTKAGLSAMQIVAIRALLSAILLGGYLALKNPSALKIRLRDAWMFTGTGIFSLVLFNWCYFTVIRKSTVSVAVVLLYTSPVWVTILSFAIFKEKFTAKKLLALLLTFLGCALAAGLFYDVQSVSLPVLLIGLCSGLGYGLYSIFGRVALARYSSYTVTFYTFIFAALAALPLCGPAELFSLAFSKPSALLWGIGVAALCTVLPYLLYTFGLTRMDAGKAATIVTVEPIVGLLWGALFYREALSAANLLGAALVIASVALLSLEREA